MNHPILLGSPDLEAMIRILLVGFQLPDPNRFGEAGCQRSESS